MQKERHPSGVKIKPFVTLDQKWFDLSNFGGKTSFRYFKAEKQDTLKSGYPQSWNFLKKVCGGWGNVRQMYPSSEQAPPKAKNNSEYFIEHGFKPSLEREVPPLKNSDTPKGHYDQDLDSSPHAE